MRILISGGAGFLGSHLTDLLLAQGHEVVGVDNFITGKEENILHLAGNPKYKFIRQDVIEAFKVDGQGTWNLLELSLQKNARFLMASTSETYGDPSVHPQREEYWGNVNPIGLRSMYDEAKRFSEAC